MSRVTLRTLRCDGTDQISRRVASASGRAGPAACSISLNQRGWGIRLSCLTGLLVQVPGPMPVACFEQSVRSPGEIPISLVSVN